MLGLGNSLNRGGSGSSLLLDAHGGASGAFSTRRLSSSYSGNCVKVRNDSDALLDIGFSGAGIDSESLEAHCGTGDGFVHTWYDQSGSDNHATTDEDADQPRIVNSGTYDGGIVFDHDDRQFTFYDLDGDQTLFFVINTSDTKAVLFDATATGGQYLLAWESGSGTTNIHSAGVGTPSYYIDGAAQSWSTWDNVHDAITGGQKLLTIADIDITSTSNNWTPMYVGNYNTFMLNPATVNELIIYGSVLDSVDQSGVEGNIMAGHGL